MTKARTAQEGLIEKPTTRDSTEDSLSITPAAFVHGRIGREVGAVELVGDCPCGCGGAGDLAVTLKVGNDGRERWFYTCNHFTGARGDYFFDLAVALGISTADLGDGRAPIPGLRERGPGGGPARRDAEPLPTEAHFAGWHSALWAHEPAMAWLHGRGVSDDVIRELEIGWDGDRRRLVLPMRLDGEIVAYKWRSLRGGKWTSPAGSGRPWPLYPEPTGEQGWVLIVAGESDAHAGRSVGLPASSVTLGAGTWRENWTGQLAAPVVVMFDNSAGERRSARAVVRKLRAAGVDARRLDLARDLGFKKPGGDLCDYLAARGPKLERRRERVLRAVKEGSR